MVLHMHDKVMGQCQIMAWKYVRIDSVSCAIKSFLWSLDKSSTPSIRLSLTIYLSWLMLVMHAFPSLEVLRTSDTTEVLNREVNLWAYQRNEQEIHSINSMEEKKQSSLYYMYHLYARSIRSKTILQQHVNIDVLVVSWIFSGNKNIHHKEIKVLIK